VPNDLLVLRTERYLVYVKPDYNFHVWKYSRDAGGYTDLIILTDVDDRSQLVRLDLPPDQMELLLAKLKLLRGIHG